MSWRFIPGLQTDLFAVTYATGRAGDSYTFAQADGKTMEYYRETDPALLNLNIRRAVSGTVAAMIRGKAQSSYPSFPAYEIGGHRPLPMGWNPYASKLMAGPDEVMTINVLTDDFKWWCATPVEPGTKLAFTGLKESVKVPLPTFPVYVVPILLGCTIDGVFLGEGEIGKRGDGSNTMDVSVPDGGKTIIIWKRSG